MIATAGACRSGDAPPADGRIATWLDISPAIGDPPRDPGDALALLQAYGSGTLRVRGVSVTFGNVPLERGYPAAQELLKRLDSGLLRAWRGASAPDERAAPTEATELLEEALGKEPLTIVATGPATTIASVLLRQPAMASRIERVILVAGTPVDATGAALESGPTCATPGGAGRRTPTSRPTPTACRCCSRARWPSRWCRRASPPVWVSTPQTWTASMKDMDRSS